MVIISTLQKQNHFDLDDRLHQPTGHNHHTLQIEDGTPRTEAFGVSGYLAWHIILLVFALQALHQGEIVEEERGVDDEAGHKKYCMDLGEQLEKSLSRVSRRFARHDDVGLLI